MITERETLGLVRSWLADGRTRLPNHVLDAVLTQIPETPQRRPRWPARRITDMNALTKSAIAAAAVVTVAIVGFNVLRTPGTNQIGSPSPSANVSPSPRTEATPSTDGSLPKLPLPGTRSSPAGEYGWEGGPGSAAGMHRVIEGEGREATVLIFRVGDDCLAASEDRQVAVNVAGLDGVSVEPYEPPVPFGSSDGNEITRAYALPVADRTLCVFLTWHATTTEGELEAAEGTLDTLRAVPVGEDRIRITFTLQEGWDIG